MSVLSDNAIPLDAFSSLLQITGQLIRLADDLGSLTPKLLQAEFYFN